ncbi:FK506-binding protein [Drechslerella stenobrocha 248]|uniref:peptidylprolyl isomerase n=1 Tax=Drechslerella stenobrocha 248 TaxID=1043628 RepID=W7HWG0_9PEZI|nr:FK506-binding protein [Drechslerella stenobrocha 248]
MGVEKNILRAGNGTNFPRVGDRVGIHYTGRLENGQEFDSSISRGEPLFTRIGVGQVIKGWDEAIVTMSLGEKAILTISSDYGYGASGFPGLIPPHATLIFEVELVKIN